MMGITPSEGREGPQGVPKVLYQGDTLGHPIGSCLKAMPTTTPPPTFPH